MKINLQRTITSLTTALDFVGTDEYQHGKRVALIGAGASGFQIAPAIADKVEHLFG